MRPMPDDQRRRGQRRPLQRSATAEPEGAATLSSVTRAPRRTRAPLMRTTGNGARSLYPTSGDTSPASCAGGATASQVGAGPGAPGSGEGSGSVEGSGSGSGDGSGVGSGAGGGAGTSTGPMSAERTAGPVSPLGFTACA